MYSQVQDLLSMLSQAEEKALFLSTVSFIKETDLILQETEENSLSLIRMIVGEIILADYGKPTEAPARKVDVILCVAHSRELKKTIRIGAEELRENALKDIHHDAISGHLVLLALGNLVFHQFPFLLFRHTRKNLFF